MSNQGQLGIQFHRSCSESQRNIIEELIDSLREKSKQLSFSNSWWHNLFFNGKHFLFADHQKQQQELNKFCQGILDQFYPQSKLILLAAGIMHTSKERSQDQDFHQDYFGNSVVFFIPLANMTTKNSTQFLSIPVQLPIEAKSNYGGDLRLLEFLEARNVSHYVVSQIVCRAFSILSWRGATVHRGIANKASWDRPVFYISASYTPVDVHEPEFVESKIVYQEPEA